MGTKQDQLVARLFTDSTRMIHPKWLEAIGIAKISNKNSPKCSKCSHQHTCCPYRNRLLFSNTLVPKMQGTQLCTQASVPPFQVCYYLNSLALFFSNVESKQRNDWKKNHFPKPTWITWAPCKHTLHLHGSLSLVLLMLISIYAQKHVLVKRFPVCTLANEGTNYINIIYDCVVYQFG